ncbi:hypothetical protein AVEN_104478-1 [Araneus ventricosus]|uniref:Uncharacterized protein n=1 Tax=Araneus ventricosus TaxID=182803 RepID=A0A4Y1ZWC0_ARAVE|nr:hypothetical protein AVEN_104478-1 [Araneus ventricosus]
MKNLLRPGQAHVVTNSTTISTVDELIRQNRRITTREIAVIGKVCAQWVSKHLSENLKTAKWELDFSNTGVTTLRLSTPFLRAGISVSMSMAIIYSCTVPHKL